MNKERLLALADFIEKLPLENDINRSLDGPTQTFDMSTYVHRPHECRTAACIAGWAVHLFGDINDRREGISEQARDALSLTEAQSSWLFLGMWTNGGLPWVKPTEAATVIRAMVSHGGIPTT